MSAVEACLARGRANTPRGPRIEVVSLGWLAWAGVAILCLGTSASAWVPLCVVVSVVVVWWHRGWDRRGLGTPVLLAGTVLVALWAVVTVVVGPSSGGQVVWVLPQWAPQSGAPLGGPVTVGRLWGGAEQAMRAVAHLAVLALAARCVSAEQGARTADVLLGRMAPLVHPWCFVAHELALAERSRGALTAHGLGRFAVSLAGVSASVAARCTEWRVTHPSAEGRLRTRLRLVAALCVVSLALWAATARIVNRLEASLLVLLALGLTGGVISRARITLTGSVDLAPLVCAVATLCLHLLGASADVTALSLLLLAVVAVVFADRRVDGGPR